MVKPVSQHIQDAHGGSRADFARACDVLPQQVTKWINGGFKVTAEGFVIGDTVKQDKTVKGVERNDNVFIRKRDNP